MRIRLLIGLLAAGAMRGQTPGPPPLDKSVRVSTRLLLVAALELETVRAGKPVRLEFHLKNISSTPISIMSLHGPNILVDSGFAVTDAHGVEVPRTERGREELWSIGETYEVIAPGQEADETNVDLASFYRLTKPGKYFVRLARGIFRGRDAEPKPGNYRNGHFQYPSGNDRSVA
ncbi:MAG TPA: hypothetical protein VGG72_10405 [Bryobacteraceae bacterium]|jgi:hypothetical protein